MRKRYFPTAGAAILALFFAAAAPAQEADAESPLSSLVLVLNVLSDTHARPSTGVVIRNATPGPAPALVLVPAEFVSAGDEIVVLDGGTDIARHGRESRTVARSADTGIALLEVEGLSRPGVEFSSDPWPSEGVAELEFAAWPAAEKLVEGAPLLRRSLKPEGAALESGAPEVSGPLFDNCGRLAALHLAGEDSRLVAGSAIADYLASAGYESVQAPCNVPIAADGDVEVEEATDQASPVMVPADPTRAVEAEAETKTKTETQGPLFMPWAWAGGLLVLAAVSAILVLSARPPRPGVRLAGAGTENRGERLDLRFSARNGAALLQREGRILAFELKGDRILVCDRGGDEANSLALVVGGTPCLPGEAFLVPSGQELRIGPETWRLQFDSKVTS